MYWTRLNSAQPHWSQLPIPTHLAQMQSNLCLYNICLHNHCLCNLWLCNLCSLTQLQKTKPSHPNLHSKSTKSRLAWTQTCQTSAYLITNLTPSLVISQVSLMSSHTIQTHRNQGLTGDQAQWASIAVRFKIQVQSGLWVQIRRVGLESGSRDWTHRSV